MTTRWIIVTVVSMLIIFVLFTAILWRVGLFNFTGTDASANIVASALALVGVFFTALVTAVGIFLKYSLDQRNADLKEEAEKRQRSLDQRNADLKDEAEKRQHSLDQRNADLKDEAEKRLKQEAAIQTVQLLSTNSGKDVPETQRAGVLFILANLGLLDLAITVLDQMLAHDRIDAKSAVWVINKALESNDEKIQLEASSILRERYGKFLMKNGQCTFPRCFYLNWNTEMPLLARQEAAEALLKMITARSYRNWDSEIFNTLILTLIAIWKTEPEMRLKNGVGICLEKIIRVYPYPPVDIIVYSPSGEEISVNVLRSELSTLSRDLTFHPSFIFEQLCKTSDMWLKNCKHGAP